LPCSLTEDALTVNQAAWGVLFFILCGNAVNAATVTVAGRSLNLDPPRGYCQADKNHAERAIVEALEKSAGKGPVVLMVFAQCDELNDLRQGKIKDLRRYGQYVALPVLGAIEPQPPGVIRVDFVESIAASFKSADSDSSARKDAKTPRQYPDVKTGERKSLGLLAKDANAAYIGALQGFKSLSGNESKLASVAAITLLNGIAVNTDLFEVYTAGPDIDRLLDQQKSNVSALIAKNS
jgi:hypothetical protein